MADDSLNQPVIVRAVSLNASSIPAGLSPAYTQYILSQSQDFTNVAGKANEAGQGAYEAQVKNEQQDVILADHESRISALRVEVDGHELRITANTNAISLLDIRLATTEGKIVTLRSDVDYLLDEVIGIESDIDNIQADYVSKSATSSQTLASPLNVATSYSVGGTKVVGARQTGWTTSTGSALIGAFNSNQAYGVSSTYSQTEIQNIVQGLQQARQRIKGLEDMARAHGLIN